MTNLSDLYAGGGAGGTGLVNAVLHADAIEFRSPLTAVGDVFPDAANYANAVLDVSSYDSPAFEVSTTQNQPWRMPGVYKVPATGTTGITVTVKVLPEAEQAWDGSNISLYVMTKASGDEEAIPAATVYLVVTEATPSSGSNAIIVSGTVTNANAGLAAGDVAEIACRIDKDATTYGNNIAVVSCTVEASDA